VNTAKPRVLDESKTVAPPARSADSGDGFPDRLAQSLAAAYPGPALFVNVAGDLVVANGAARGLVDFLQSAEGEAMRAGIASRLSEGGAGNVRVSFQADATERTLELTLTHIRADVPDSGEGVLVLGRDITGERNVINALVTSRQLYRDLVECSADFGWETDAAGAFTYISPQGGFGYSARELNGIRSSELLLDSSAVNAFNVQHRYRNVEVWLRRKDNSRACVVVSSVPTHDARGRWLGSRGMCRDVTAVKAHLLQEDILARIIDAIRNCVDPTEALETAARHIVEVFAPARSLVAKKTQSGFELAANHGFDTGAASKALDHFSLVLGESGAQQNRTVIEYSDSVSRILAAPSFHHGAVNGVVLAERAISEGAWSDQERNLLQGIADQFGVAIEQVNSYKALEDLTRIDELTGLLNRRAFYAAIATRVQHQHRTGRPASLLYLDVDNFKAVNDLLGHQEGDRVLRRIGEMIRTKSRAGDMAARIGGDEFLIWLEDTGLDGAVSKAKTLLQDVNDICGPVRSADIEVGVSIGVTVSDPAEQITLESLVSRADSAMYATKRAGKSGYSVFREADQAKAC
jgi:diguanylate cyclase (GGDEF)-like protein/PAS domain S-box-containing protein